MEIKEIEVQMTSANYQFSLVVGLQNEKVLEEIIRRGIKTAVQPALLAWEASIAYPDVRDEATGKVTKGKRPAGFTRKQIPFSEAGAQLLEKILGTEVKVEVEGEDEAKEIGVMDVKGISEYTGATGPEPKFKRAKDTVTNYLFEADGKTPKTTKDGQARTIESYVAAMAKVHGLVLTVPEPGESWTDDTDFLRAVQNWLVEEDKKKMAMD